METKDIGGMWFCDTTLQKDYGGVIPGKGVSVNKENGEVTFPNPVSPDNDLLFFRLHRHPNGDLFFGGKAHNQIGGNAWVRNIKEDNYHDLGPTHGNSPICFWKEFVFVVSSPISVDQYDIRTFNKVQTLNQNIGSQGIRFIRDFNGTPVTGDETYSGKHAEWTQLWDSTIGQSYLGGATLIYNEGGRDIHKVVEPGNTTFIRAYQNFDDIAVAIVKPGYAAFRWFKWSERASLPNEQIIVIPPVTPIPPTPEPEPKPMSTGITDEQFADLNNIRNEVLGSTSPNIKCSDEQRGLILNTFAFKHRNDEGHKLGLEAKPGSNTKQPLSGIAIWNGIRIIDKDGKHWGQDICGACSAGFFKPTRGEPGPAAETGSHGFVVPVNTDVSNIPDIPDNGNSGGTSSADIEALKVEIAQLRIELSKAIKRGDNIGLQTNNGKYLCAEGGGGMGRNEEPLSTDRSEKQGWETFKIV